MGDKVHAIRSASNAERWLNCPGSVTRIINMKLPNYQSTYSVEGDVFHDLMFQCVSEDRRPHTYEGEIHDFKIGAFEAYHAVTIDAEMVYHAETCLDWVNQYKLANNCQLILESPYGISFLTGEEGAESTPDIVIITKIKGGHKLSIVDYKYGAGKDVQPTLNKQLMMYALAAIEYHKYANFLEVELVILQPRCGGNKVAKVSLEELDKFKLEVEKQSKISHGLKATVEGCMFCPSKHDCPELEKETQKLALVGLQDESNGNHPNDITKEQWLSVNSNQHLADLAKRFELYDIFKKAVLGEIEARVLAGQNVPGWKQVKGKLGNRKWDNEESLAESLLMVGLSEDVLYYKTLNSPTKLEKILKKDPTIWDFAKEFIVREEGKTIVVPEVHKGLEVNPIAGLINESGE